MHMDKGGVGIGKIRETGALDVAGEALRDLFQMTPYYWKTPKTGAKRLADLESLTTRISFRIHIFQKL